MLSSQLIHMNGVRSFTNRSKFPLAAMAVQLAADKRRLACIALGQIETSQLVAARAVQHPYVCGLDHAEILLAVDTIININDCKNLADTSGNLREIDKDLLVVAILVGQPLLLPDSRRGVV